MKSKVAALLALPVLAACSGNPIGDTPPTPGPDTPGQPTAPSDGNGRTVEAMRAFSYDGETLEIDMAGVSSSGEFGTFNRRPAMDVPARGGAPRLLAYEFQETNMTRSYLAYVAENERETLLAVAASDGGQFNENNGGGGWIRLTGYARPDIAASPSPSPGPEQGTFSYYGTYAGVFVPGFLDPATPPRPGSAGPGESLSVRGEIQVNAQFERSGEGEVVEGAIVRRTLQDRNGNRLNSISVVDGSGAVTEIDTSRLADLVLRETEISDNGTFLGAVEFRGSPGQAVGNYDGAFGGDGATDVAGVIWVNPIQGESNIWEYGAFNLPRCDLAGASPICTPR